MSTVPPTSPDQPPHQPPHQPSDHRIAPAVAARLVGAGLALAGVLVAATVVLVAVLDVPGAVVLVVGLVALLAVAALAAALTWRGTVVRLGPEGYRVRLVRGAGVRAARWADVHDVVTSEVAGSRCVVVRLRDGRSTTIPVDVLAGDREEFARAVAARLQAARPGARRT